MRGANLAWFHKSRGSTRAPIVAAGGISTSCKITTLQQMGMDAAVGMALYMNRLG